jgi:predicted RNase H-like HicB family nuclease
MSRNDKYARVVEWSDEDACFIGSCPELFYGGCHGPEARAVFAELCDLVEETLELYQREGRPLPPPLTGRDFVNAMQRVA